MADGELRLFVACELPDDVREALARVQQDLRRLDPPALRWVRPEGIHVTLKFLGAVPRDRLDPVVEALESAVEPFELTVTPAEVGGFPSAPLRAGGGARLRVLWVGLAGDVEPLAALARRVDEALAPLGFPAERRPFRAHLTLARVQERASNDDRKRLAELVRGYRLPPCPSMTLTSVHLIQSTLKPGGSVYTGLASVPRGANLTASGVPS